MAEAVIWRPSPEKFQKSRLNQFMRDHGLSDYDSLYKQSISDPAWYWDAVVKDLAFEWYVPYQEVLDTTNGLPWTKWFTGGKTNVAHNCVDKWVEGPAAQPDKTALIWEGDRGEVRHLTYRQLHKETDQLAHGLEALGVGVGDRIALYLPMIPEAAVAILAAAKIGAIFTPIFSGYGQEAIATRVNDCQAKVLFTVDGFFRRGKLIKAKEEADRAAALCPSIEKVVVVRRAGNDISWQEERDIWYDQLILSQACAYETKWLDSEDPVMVIYTSGTTGKPKGAVHVHPGFPLKSAQDMAHCMNLGADDIIFWLTDMGWMMGPWLVFGSLILGATMVFYEGVPDYPKPDRLWAMVEQHRITLLGIAPTGVRALMAQGSAWAKGYDLSSLRSFASSGEPWNPDPWHWLFNDVGQRKLPIINYSGGTEVSGGIVGCFPAFPIKPCSFTGPIPGIAADVVDDQCQPVRGQVGELVIRRPWPGMTRGFWRNPDRYLDTYWSRWPDVWVHGDWAEVDADGFWYIRGRSDDVIKVAGKRIGPSEVESVLVSNLAVLEAAAIGVPSELKGEECVCFVVLRPGREATGELQTELKELVATSLGNALRPKSIHILPELPHTRNGKVVRRALRSAYLGEQAGDLSSVENPEVLAQVREQSFNKN